LRDVNDTLQLEELIGAFEDGDILMFVGQENFDETHPMSGATPKFVVISRNETRFSL